MTDDGVERAADHVLLATGFQVDVARYGFLSAGILRGLRTHDGYPDLRAGLESSVPGLHFLGAPAARSFGPLCRFVSGTAFAGAELARRLARRRSSAVQPTPARVESLARRMSFSEAMLELPREHDPGPRSAFGAREFFRAFFSELEAREIPYAILHGGDALPDRIDSDIDFAVQEADLAKLGPLIAGLAREHGWVVAQRWQHEVSAIYTVVIDPNAPAQHLALDACSHFCRAGCFLVRDTVLLARRARHPNGFFVTSAACGIHLSAREGARRRARPGGRGPAPA